MIPQKLENGYRRQGIFIIIVLNFIFLCIVGGVLVMIF